MSRAAAWFLLAATACSVRNVVNACLIPGRCSEVDCEDGLDEDGDGATDCEDGDCRTSRWLGSCPLGGSALCVEQFTTTMPDDPDFEDPSPLDEWTSVDLTSPGEAPVVNGGVLNWEGFGGDNDGNSALVTKVAHTLVPSGLVLSARVSVPWTNAGLSRGVQIGIGRLPSLDNVDDTTEPYLFIDVGASIFGQGHGALVSLRVADWLSDETVVTAATAVADFHDFEARIAEDGTVTFWVDEERVATAPVPLVDPLREAKLVILGRDVRSREGEVLIDSVEVSTPGGRPAGCLWGNPVLAPGEGLVDIVAPAVVEHEDQIVILMGMSDGSGVMGGSNVGHSSSPDGYEWGEVREADAVMPSGAWGFFGIYDPFVRVVRGGLEAYVTITTTDSETSTWRATSDDAGETWEHEAMSIFETATGQWNHGLLGRVAVTEASDRLVMAYGEARSGSLWLVDGDEGGDWGGERREILGLRESFEKVSCPWFISTGDGARLLMLYEREGGVGGSVIDMAYSDDDGETWRQLPSNPLLRAREGDNVRGVGCPTALLDEEAGLLRVWYASNPAIGYAEFDISGASAGE